ncbi:clathrin associated protein complex large subunit [Rhizophlyctis rosea]|nr:clathrin associated protein complex large subunit [Rhizophlyctis rosea]
MEVELQQRAVEYDRIMGLDEETRAALLERVPVLESALKEEAKKGSGVPVTESAPAAAAPSGGGELLGGLNDDLMGLSVGGTGGGAGGAGGDIYNMVFGGASGGAGAGAGKSDNIMDLLGGIGLGSTPAATSAPSAAQAPKPSTDLLGDLFGGGPALSPAPVSVTATPSTISADPLGDLLGGFGGGGAVGGGSGGAEKKSYVCYDKNGLRITLLPSREAAIEGVNLRVEATLENLGGVGVAGVAFQVAVPKTQTIVWLQALSSTDIPPGGRANQIMRIDNPKKAPIRLRLKVTYNVGGQQVDEIVEFSGFDASLWA